MQRLRAIASGLGALDADAPETQPAAATAEEPTTQPTQLLSPEEIRSFKENGFVVAKGLVSRAMTDAVLDYAWANTPPEVDRHDPQSWIDPKNRWQAEGGSLAGGIDVQRDETGKRPGIFSPMNNWKFHAAFFSDEGQRLMTLWNEGPVQAVVKQLGLLDLPDGAINMEGGADVHLLNDLQLLLQTAKSPSIMTHFIKEQFKSLRGL